MPRNARSGGDPQDVPADEPLENWLAQERAELADSPPASTPGTDERTAPSGWWIVPAVALGVPAWAVLLRWLFW